MTYRAVERARASYAPGAAIWRTAVGGRSTFTAITR
jgi:hypothetical protein